MRDEEMVRVSVRGLVEFILRSGDIDNRRGAMGDREAMQMGSRLHRKLQGRMGKGYQSEVPLAAVFPCDDFLIRVEGRADGIFEENGLVTVDEIKGVMRSLARLEEPVDVHLAQAKCYAYVYAADHQLEEIGVRMSYGNLETEEIRYFRFRYSLRELEEWFMGVLEEYRKWARWERKWHALRQSSIQGVEFPFPYRQGQRQLAGDVYRTINRGKILFIQAPTGVGKTISTVFPAVKAVGQGKGEKIFYLTAKTIARTVADEAFGLLRAQGLRFKSVVLTAKEKICRCGTPECNPEACPYARGHFDRINEAVYTLLSERDAFDRESIVEASERFRVCPFELSLDLSLWMDGIIGDYHYVFHPRARLKRFFGDGVKGDYLFLIDEAHNLVDRGREMYSAQLYKEDFLALKKQAGPFSPRLGRALGRCSQGMLAMKRECDVFRVVSSLGTFPITLTNLYGIMEDYLEDGERQADPPAVREAVLQLYFQVGTFLETWDSLDEHVVIYQELEGDGRFKLKLFCVDPSLRLQECLDKARSSILFSATLLPIDYYKRLLSTRTDNYAVYAHSCFDPGRLQVVIGVDTSSRYIRRSQEEYRRIAQYIRGAVSARRGNYLVFFSSYRMLEDVAQCFREIVDGETDLILQKPGMSEEKREEFLREFAEDRGRSLVGFCVMGSIFGEGIDLKQNRLIGSIIVGTGLPQVCPEQQILKGYYDDRGMDGFCYAYQYPGMNKVLQAAGRVIRTEQDKGVVLLLDGRFASSGYRDLFPREWARLSVTSLPGLSQNLSRFWDSPSS